MRPEVEFFGLSGIECTKQFFEIRPGTRPSKPDDGQLDTVPRVPLPFMPDSDTSDL